jgi:hypothetical protein
MIDFVIGLLQGLAFAFVIYGAFLATSRAGVRSGVNEPFLASADSEKRLVLEGSLEPRSDRRRRTRRKADRRKGLRPDLYGFPM